MPDEEYDLGEQSKDSEGCEETAGQIMGCVEEQEAKGDETTDLDAIVRFIELVEPELSTEAQLMEWHNRIRKTAARLTARGELEVVGPGKIS